MSKYIDAEKLKAKIKHLKLDVYDEAHQFDLGARSSLAYLEDFIDSLQQEQPIGIHDIGVEGENGVNASDLPECQNVFKVLSKPMQVIRKCEETEKSALKKCEEVDLEKEIEIYFQGLWPGMETAEQCNTDMHFTPPAIMRLARHFYELGKNAK